MISNIELSAMSSHANIKVTTLDAAGTVNSDIKNNSRRLSAVRERSSPFAYPTTYTSVARPTNDVIATNSAPSGSRVRFTPVKGNTSAEWNDDERPLSNT